MTVFSTKNGKTGCSGVCKPRYPVLPFFLTGFRLLIILCLIFFLPGISRLEAADPGVLPVISRLDSRDIVFRQYMSDVEAARRNVFASRRNVPAEEIASTLTIYSYIIQNNEELLKIAARCNIPYSTLASLNRLSHSEDLSAENVLLLPSTPGIFIPEKPDTDLERLLFSAREEIGVIVSIPREGKTEQFRFVPGDDFSPTERIYFLNRGFSYPLRNFQISSAYGPRINPVTGRSGMHAGLDLSAPEGSPVYAAKNGTVIETGEDAIMGKYVILGHDNNWLSFYGHLSAILAVPQEQVSSGSLIGRVGSTGQSTGPHLHFELRQGGRSRDPARMLGLFSITGSR